MMICHCNIITDAEIEEVVLAFLAEDPWQLIVPAKVYRELSKRGRCCGCFPNVVDIIVRVTENFHLQQARTLVERIDVQTRLEALKQQIRGNRREGSTRGHRAA